MVNNGDGTFTVDENRAPTELRWNPPEAWYHLEGHLADLDNDGDLDLALGQNRDSGPTTVNQFSIVLVNDGTGHYPARIELPRPAFNEGFTSVRGQAHFDVDGDGLQDLLMMHTRNDDAPPTLPFTGRYVQVLVNRGGTFVDETVARMGDQAATTAQRGAYGEPLHNYAGLSMHDVDRDGCADLAMSRGISPVRAESPLVYRNDGEGRFEAMSPVPFGGSPRYFGYRTVPADVNGDGAVDFVVPYPNTGPDREHGPADDLAVLVTLLNTAPAGPARCGAMNRPPRPAEALADRRLAPDDTLNVDVSRAFVDPDGDSLSYTASSSAPLVVEARAAGALVTLTAVGEGAATIRVTATDAGGLSAAQTFTATVSTTVSGSFTDEPIQPGTTPIRAVHFTELRTRIDVLRVTSELVRFAWTDPVLTAGVTRVRLVHLLELRSALAEAYAALGRRVPSWTDVTPTAGAAPIRAAHLMELRAAVMALE